MCGISGIFRRPDTRVSADLLDAMGQSLTHRGPDHYGQVNLGNIGMTHNRLSLLDLSETANQPFHNGDFLLSYSGEIYNHQEIRTSLENRHGVKFKTTSDTEVLFESLIHDGIDKCLSDIRGMFAFAFFDKNRGDLILARDRFGIKPLFYLQNSDGISWASEIKALATAFGLKPDPIRTLCSIGGSGERSRSNTLFKGVYAIEPGTYLKIENSQEVCCKTYYSHVDLFDIAYRRRLETQSTKDLISEFDQLLVNAVKRMLSSDVPMGIFVSGGVDSSLIAAIANSIDPRLSLFTANIVGSMSEYLEAQKLSEHLGSKLAEYRFEPEMFLRDWAESTYHYESPIIVHANSIPFGGVAKLARDSGIKAVLTGEGADELFFGYPKLITQKYRRFALLPNTFIRSLYRLVPGLSEYLFPESNSTPTSLLPELVENFESHLLKDYSDRLVAKDGRSVSEQALSVRMLSEHLLTLLHRNDRMGMMGSIEARFPFLDEDIVKFALNLPVRHKIKFSLRFHNYKHPFYVDKWLVRKTAERYIPRNLAYKKKFGFGMFGHKFLRIAPEFFRGGWLADTLELKMKTIEYLTKTQDPYFVAKLASIDVFGRLFGSNEERSDVTSRITNHIAFDGIAA